MKQMSEILVAVLNETVAENIATMKDNLKDYNSRANCARMRISSLKKELDCMHHIPDVKLPGYARCTKCGATAWITKDKVEKIAKA